MCGGTDPNHHTNFEMPIAPNIGAIVSIEDKKQKCYSDWHGYNRNFVIYYYEKEK